MMEITQQEFVEHLKTGTSDCVVCGNKLTGEWTDLNGEMRCLTCGMPHQVISWKYGDEWLAELGLTRAEIATPHCVYFEKVDLYRAYWNETKQRIPRGTYLGCGNNGNSHKDTLAFCRWVQTHRAEYEDYGFDWDAVAEIVKEAEQA